MGFIHYCALCIVVAIGKFESFRVSAAAAVSVVNRAIMRSNLWFCNLIHPVNQLSSIVDKKIEKLRATVSYNSKNPSLGNTYNCPAS